MDNVTCQMCSKPYTDPRFLTCLHSFCHQCLHKELEKATALQQQSIQCPTCQRKVPCPEGGASTFPENLHLEFEVEVARCMAKVLSAAAKSSEVPCDFCANHCNRAATVFCCSCHRFLCEGGSDSHGRVPELVPHRVVPINEETAALLPSVMKPIDRDCSKHHGHYKQGLDFYCLTCRCFVCRDCIIVHHRNHDIAEVSAVAKVRREELKGALPPAQNAATMLANAAAVKGQLVQALKASKGEAEVAILEAFRKMAEALEQRKKELLLELEALVRSKVVPLTQQREHVGRLRGDLLRYCDMTAHGLQTHTDYEVVALEGTFPMEIGAAVGRAEAAARAPNVRGTARVSLRTDAIVRDIFKFGSVMDTSSVGPNNVNGSSNRFMFLPAVRAAARYHVRVEAGKGYQCKRVQAACQEQQEEEKEGKDKEEGKAAEGESQDEVVVLEEEELQDLGNGVYAITLGPQWADGPHKLHIVVEGQRMGGGASKEDFEPLASPKKTIDVEQPYCVAIDDNGDIYVGSNSDCVYVFDQDGHLKSTLGSSGSGDGQFNVPADLCIKGATMFVADLSNNRVQKVTTEGKFLATFGKEGSGQGQFRGPSGVLLDPKGRVVVSDRDNNRVQVFTQEGQWLMTIDGNVAGDSAFSGPCGLALDPQGNLHVAAGASNAIKVFSGEGAHMRTYGAGEVSGPTGVVVDHNGYSLVTEGDGHCLSIFDPRGHKVHTVTGNLNNPTGVTLDDRSGSIYVANFIGCNVLKYTV